MTDRVNGWIVILERDLRDDDAAGVEAALKLIKGVVDVQPVKADTTTIVARAQARGELIARIGRVLDEFYV